MQRRDFLKTAGIGAAAMCLPKAVFAAPSEPRKRPNILLITTDQQHIDTISALGCNYISTPAMDSLARRGVSFTHSYASYPLCTPARSSWFTGYMPSETGVVSNSVHALRPGMQTIGTHLSSAAGYECVHSGKWHVGHAQTYHIPGFNVLASGANRQGHLGDMMVTRSLEGFLRNRTREKPFLASAAYLQPHDICEWLPANRQSPGELRYRQLADVLPPLPPNFEPAISEPPNLAAERSRQQPARGEWDELQWRYYLWSYYRHVEMVDAEIARLLATLDECGYGEDTMIIFNSDHGEGLARHRMVAKNYSYNENLKVPYIVVWPGRVEQNRINNTSFVSTIDVVATICAAAGVEPIGCRWARDTVAMSNGKGDDREFICAELRSARIVVSKGYKYVCGRGRTNLQLFDMVNDPGETSNLAGEAAFASVLEQHHAMLTQWEAGLDRAPSVEAFIDQE